MLKEKVVLMAKVTIDNLDTAIRDILEDYADDIQQDLEEATNRIAKVGVQALRNESKSLFNGNKYATGWTSTIQKGRLGLSVVLHNKQAGLPHLLEHSHQTGKNGRYIGRPHIKPVEEKLIKDFEEEIVRRIQR